MMSSHDVKSNGQIRVYFWRTHRRAKPWQCAKCRYDLRGLDGGVCPECGAPTEREA